MNGIRQEPGRDFDRLGDELVPRDRVGQLAAPNPSGTVIVTDYRTPDRFRFGLSPLTTRFTDVWTAVDAARDIIETKHGEDHG